VINVGDWVVIEAYNRKYKGYVLEKSVYRSIVNVWVHGAKTFSPMTYMSDQIIPLPLDTFSNEKEMYIDASLLLGCRDTFMEVTNKENRSV
jgi:hypothetical protein